MYFRTLLGLRLDNVIGFDICVGLFSYIRHDASLGELSLGKLDIEVLYTGNFHSLHTHTESYLADIALAEYIAGLNALLDDGIGVSLVVLGTLYLELDGISVSGKSLLIVPAVEVRH